MIYLVLNYQFNFGVPAGPFKKAKDAKAARDYTATAKQMSAKHGRYWQEAEHDHSEIHTYSSLRALKNKSEPIRIVTTFKL
jgi:hypothetical protein